MLRNIFVYLQRMILTSGDSTRHNCDMKRRIPASRVVPKSYEKSRPDTLLASTLKSMKVVAELRQVGADVADRLRADPGVVSVWRILLQEKSITADAIPDELRMRYWGLSEHRVSPQQLACVALSAFVASEFSLPHPARRQRDLDDHAAPYFAAAEICRQLRHEAPHPSAEDREHLDRAADYIESHMSWQLKHTAAAYVVGDRSNENSGGAYRSYDVLTRGRTRALSKMMRTIFGKPHDDLVAMIASVALNLTSLIPKQSVRNWAKQGTPINSPPS
jgi:hypothetical protein